MRVISQTTTLLAAGAVAFFHLSAAAPVLMDDAVLELAVQSGQPEESPITLSMATPRDSVAPVLNLSDDDTVIMPVLQRDRRASPYLYPDLESEHDVRRVPSAGVSASHDGP